MDVDSDAVPVKSCLNTADKYNMDLFINPVTRDETFQMLFDEVEELNKKTEKLRVFFDQRGNFCRDKYEESNYRIDRKLFNEYRAWVS